MTAIADVVYFCGYKPEHFTGPTPSDPPTYKSVTASSTVQANGLGYITLSDGSLSPYPNQPQRIYGNFTDSTGSSIGLDSLWMTVQMSAGINPNNGFTYENNLGIVTGLYGFHDNEGNTLIIQGFTDGTVGIYIYDISTQITTKYGDSISFMILTHDSSSPCTQIYVNIQNAGTKNGIVSLYSADGTLKGTVTLDLTSYSNFTKCSFSCTVIQDIDTGNAYQGISEFFYAYVTNYDPRQSYLIYDTGTAAATKKDWSGNNSTFNTYPLNYLTTADGYYTTTVGDEVTFAASNTAVSVPAGFEVRTVFTSDAMVCGANDTGVAVEGIVYDTTTATESTTSTAFTLSPTGSNFFQTLYTDPITGKPWTTDGFNNYEFGVKRTS